LADSQASARRLAESELAGRRNPSTGFVLDLLLFTGPSNLVDFGFRSATQDLSRFF